MAAASQHSRPALHSAMLPSQVGKGSSGAERSLMSTRCLI